MGWNRSSKGGGQLTLRRWYLRAPVVAGAVAGVFFVAAWLKGVWWTSLALAAGVPTGRLCAGLLVISSQLSHQARGMASRAGLAECG